MFTPWGAPIVNDRLERGVSYVRTKRHGGFMISRGFAENRLSAAARKEAVRFGEYFAFEMDHAWALPLWELPQLWQHFAKTHRPEMETDPKGHLLSILSAHYVDYLAEAVGLDASFPDDDVSAPPP
jgi:hypothetical protein